MIKKISLIAILLVSALFLIGAYNPSYDINEYKIDKNMIRTIDIDKGKYDRVQVLVNVEDQKLDDDMVYEAWLVDDDTQYKLSIGAFETFNGMARHIYKEDMVNFDIYDKIVITKEPVGDMDPQPGEAVLSVALN
jgi:hypothetical protein